MEDRMLKNTTLVLLALITAISAAHATTYHVTESGSGRKDGSDWSNAFQGLPAALHRGATYYIADGIYGGYVFDDPVSQNQYITIRKATQADHGSDLGWQSSFGDGQAVFKDRFRIDTSYWVIDGAVGTGRNGHGFKIDMTDVLGANVAIHSTGSHVTLRHIHIYWPDNHDERYLSQVSTSMGIQFYHTGGIAPTDVVIQHCFLDKTPGTPVRFVGADSVLIEDSHFYRMHSDAARHASGIIVRDVSSNKGVIRNNFFEQMEGSYAIGFYHGGTRVEHRNWQIYGNVFAWYDGPGMPSHLIAFNWNDDIVVSDLSIHNNAFYDSRGAGAASGKIAFGRGGSNKTAYNNIFYGMSYHIMNGIEYDYNYYSRCSSPYAFSPEKNENPFYEDAKGKHSIIVSDPFIDALNRDFRLREQIEGYPGLNLGVAVDDTLGNLRGADGVWDRGALEFVSGACAPSCSGKDCGPDGCGGSCGTCGTGYECVSGSCQRTEDCNSEMLDAVSSWKAGESTLANLMEAIRIWKSECS